ncbi:MAG: alpha/beta fold hydrolase [Solirubrobacterales bacterium]|nr:alpha/beta fold hydrolase [Solirubrobacterales bacterium]
MRRTRLAFVLGVVLFAIGGSTQADAAFRGGRPAHGDFDRGLRIQSVCFSVTNPAGSTSVLYGQRFTERGVTSRTPAIVLVHGVASSTQNWDYSPHWSVARSLARAGYVVISYDRLGYAKSSYFDHPGGGLTLTTSVQRDLLHQVVGEVRTGRYATTRGSDCSSPQRPSRLRNRTVVIVGHSAGGWIVAGYPGKYHDVAAMVQADITAGTPLATGPDTHLMVDPNHPDYFQFFGTSQDCRAFDIYAPGAVPSVARLACTPPFVDSPLGELSDIPGIYAENIPLIKKIGSTIPVLLTSGDHDVIVPPANAKAELAFYKASCGCDVSQLILPNTGHLFMAHRSLPIWVHYVVHWLRAHGLSADRRLPLREHVG